MLKYSERILIASARFCRANWSPRTLPLTKASTSLGTSAMEAALTEKRTFLGCAQAGKALGINETAAQKSKNCIPIVNPPRASKHGQNDPVNMAYCAVYNLTKGRFVAPFENLTLLGHMMGRRRRGRNGGIWYGATIQ